MIFELQVVRFKHPTHPYEEVWTWTYQTADGEALAAATVGHPTEKAARADIARVRKAMGGARFAKVVVVPGG